VQAGGRLGSSDYASPRRVFDVTQLATCHSDFDAAPERSEREAEKEKSRSGLPFSLKTYLPLSAQESGRDFSLRCAPFGMTLGLAPLRNDGSVRNDKESRVCPNSSPPVLHPPPPRFHLPRASRDNVVIEKAIRSSKVILSGLALRSCERIRL
jgi:hypothetical protein